MKKLVTFEIETDNGNTRARYEFEHSITPSALINLDKEEIASLIDSAYNRAKRANHGKLVSIFISDYEQDKAIDEGIATLVDDNFTPDNENQWLNFYLENKDFEKYQDD